VFPEGVFPRVSNSFVPKVEKVHTDGTLDFFLFFVLLGHGARGPGESEGIRQHIAKWPTNDERDRRLPRRIVQPRLRRHQVRATSMDLGYCVGLFGWMFSYVGFFFLIFEISLIHL
jgi:hypothetical protein